MVSKIKAWLDQHQERRFQSDCDKLRIPSDVRERLRKLGVKRVDWYAGRQD